MHFVGQDSVTWPHSALSEVENSVLPSHHQNQGSVKMEMDVREFPSRSAVTNPTSIHEDTGAIPGPVQWVKMLQHCYELQCRSQTQPGSAIAVAGV